MVVRSCPAHTAARAEVTVTRPAELTAFGAEWVQAFPKSSSLEGTGVKWKHAADRFRKSYSAEYWMSEHEESELVVNGRFRVRIYIFDLLPSVICCFI